MIPNEIMLLASLAIAFGGVIVFFRVAGKTGIYVWNALVTVVANIEVVMLIRAFGMEQTLGNTLYAASFLSTDILSEQYGKKASGHAVTVALLADFLFLLITQTWLHYAPAEGDWAMPHIRSLFALTPRIMLASLAGTVASQYHDVWSYHFWWHVTGDSDRFLWVRNNCSTLISQFINNFIFVFGAFWGVYDHKTLMSVFVSGYVIYICTSLLDTPFVYIARRLYRSGKVREA